MARANQKKANNENQPAPKSIWDKISVYVTIISVVSVIALGFLNYKLGQDKNLQEQQEKLWQGRLDHSKEQLDERQRQLDLTKQELEKVTQDLNKYLKKEPIATGGTSIDKRFELNLIRATPTSLTPDLKMEITSIVFKSNPDKYLVNAKVNFKDFPEMAIGNAEAGYKVTYPEKDGYDIEVVKVGAVSATFAITKR